MRLSKSASTLLLLLFTISIAAQTWHYSHNFKPSQPHQVKWVGDSLILISVENRNNEFYNIPLLAFSPEGDFLWKSNGGQLMEISGDTIYSIWFTPEAGGHDCYQITNLYSTSLDGESIKQSEISFCASSYLWNQPVSLDVIKKQKFVYATIDAVGIISKSGEIEKVMEENNILGAYYLDWFSEEPNTIAVIHPDEIAHYNSDLEFVVSYDLSSEITNFDLYNDTLYLQFADTIYRMKDFTNLVDDTLFINKNAVGEITNFRIFEGKMWSKYRSTGTDYLIGIDLATGQITDTIHPAIQLFSEEPDYYISDSSLILAGQTNSDVALILNYPLYETFEFETTDIALSDLELIITGVYPMGEGAPLAYSTVKFDLRFRVENLGSNPIESITLQTVLGNGYPYDMPPLSVYLSKDVNINLEPGTSELISWNGLSQLGPQTSVCINVLTDPQNIEINMDNNQLCKSYPKEVPIDGESHLLVFDVFPNPVKDELFIKFNTSELRNLVLYNSIGVPLISTSTHSSETAIPVDGLSEGIYFLEIFDQKQRHTRKIEVR